MEEIGSSCWQQNCGACVCLFHEALLLLLFQQHLRPAASRARSGPSVQQRHTNTEHLAKQAFTLDLNLMWTWYSFDFSDFIQFDIQHTKVTRSPNLRKLRKTEARPRLASGFHCRFARSPCSGCNGRNMPRTLQTADFCCNRRVLIKSLSFRLMFFGNDGHVLDCIYFSSDELEEMVFLKVFTHQRSTDIPICPHLLLFVVWFSSFYFNQLYCII